MIVFTGAPGRLGRRSVDRLLERIPPGDVVAKVRDPAKAVGLAARGVPVRHGDVAQSGSLAGARGVPLAPCSSTTQWTAS